ncbi:MAG: metal-dependent hydrolase [Kyrpidia tusciae]|nr:metal-dependent hydrolase [Kyrpidia tusciae]MBE3551777.1 metal-dependent hydrolase [Kyrpidia tusciae]
MKLVYHGHACFEVEADGKRVIIDPFLSGSPVSKIKPEDVQVDAVLLTHGHGDHLGDAVAIAKRLNVPIIAPFELAAYCAKKGAQVHGMHLGGSHQFDFGKVKLTLAFHGAGIEDEDGMHEGGNPCGYLVTMGGKTFYHAGDTALFGDMKLIGDRHAIDAAALPIGDNFTMGPEDALYAVELLRPRTVIPMHYNTFPLIAQDVGAFASAVRGKGFTCQVLEVEGSLEI